MSSDGRSEASWGLEGSEGEVSTLTGRGELWLGCWGA